jgi:hypothetical protein
MAAANCGLALVVGGARVPLAEVIAWAILD